MTSPSRPPTCAIFAVPPAPPPGHPTSWVGMRIDYHGPATAHHGTFRVYAWNYCFSVPCVAGCDRFTYILAPEDPTAVDLEPGQGIRAHRSEITPLPTRAPHATDSTARLPLESSP